MKRLALLSVLFAGCTTTPKATDWPSHAKEMAAVTIENLKANPELPDWMKVPATQEKFAACLSKKASHLIEALCDPYDTKLSTKDNLMAACTKSAVIAFAAGEIQQVCVNEVAPQVLP
jgi:recombinational DNA repair protein RecT